MLKARPYEHEIQKREQINQKELSLKTDRLNTKLDLMSPTLSTL